MMRLVLHGFLRASFAVALSVALVGCGGGAQPSSETAAPEESAAPGEADSEANDADAFCEAVEAIGEAEQQLTADLQKAVGDEAAVQKAYRKFVDANEQLLQALIDAAPAEIRASAEAYVESYRVRAAGDHEKSAKLNEKGAEAIGYYRANCFG